MFSRQVLSKSPRPAFFTGRRALVAPQILQGAGVSPPINAAAQNQQQHRNMSFSFVGPKTLNEIIKTELLATKTDGEITDLWFEYHETKEDVHGLAYKGKEGLEMLERAKACPFFIQPIFRDDGFFMMVSQFQAPSHFLMAYLEDFKMDPAAAQPLLTFSVFDDYSATKDLTLVRCDILNKGIHESEGRKIVEHVVEAYKCDKEFAAVEAFNQRPDSFDVDGYIERQNEKWKTDPPSIPVTVK